MMIPEAKSNDQIIEYSIFDPTGNITALVESSTDVKDRPEVAARIMAAEPDVEQVGFVSFSGDAEIPVRLRMAGGEFCGNATMCAAALYLIRKGGDPAISADQPEAIVSVDVSGAEEPLEVRIRPESSESFASAVTMPPAIEICSLKLSDGMASEDGAGELPMVRMQGISHIIAEPDSGLFGLKDDPSRAETMLRGWCAATGADCLGIMFLEEEGARRKLTPLVYVPGADTMFWENSCASGSAAAGIYLAAKAGGSVDVTFDEPAGSMRVESDISGDTILHGSVSICK